MNSKRKTSEARRYVKDSIYNLDLQNTGHKHFDHHTTLERDSPTAKKSYLQTASITSPPSNGNPNPTSSERKSENTIAEPQIQKEIPITSTNNKDASGPIVEAPKPPKKDTKKKEKKIKAKPKSISVTSSSDSVSESQQKKKRRKDKKKKKKMKIKNKSLPTPTKKTINIENPPSPKPTLRSEIKPESPKTLSNRDANKIMENYTYIMSAAMQMDGVELMDGPVEIRE